MSSRQYIGARYVPIVYTNPDDGSAKWKANVFYEALTIVVEDNGDSYTSRKAVPASVGKPSENPEYWVKTGDFNASLLSIQNRVGNIETILGNETLETTSPIVTGAINELENALKEYESVVVTPEMFGAKGDGTTDDSTAIQNAITNGNVIVFGNKTYKIDNTIILDSNTIINLNGANIVANTGEEPLFKTVTSANYGSNKISIKGDGCIISGECSSVFELNGSNYFSISPSNYARHIIIDGIHASSDDIGTFIKMNTAVRDVFITRCTTWCKNGIVADGKTVEIMISNCILFISDSGNPLKLSSALGTRYYNEGWTVENCTIDGAENSTLYISDIYVFQMCNCYIGTDIEIDVPTTTTHTREINIYGCVITGNLTFVHNRDLTQSFYSIINNNIFTRRVVISRGAYIKVSNNMFESYSGDSAYAIGLTDNISNSEICGNKIDSTYAGGVGSNGTSITKTSVHDNSYDGSGYCVSAVAPINTYNNCGGNYTDDIISEITHGTYAVSDNIVTVPVKIGYGQKGMIVGRIHFDSPTDSSELLRFNLPTNMKVPSGSGWSSILLYTKGASVVEFSIPYYAIDDINDNVILANNAGDSVTVGYQSWIAITK